MSHESETGSYLAVHRRDWTRCCLAENNPQSHGSHHSPVLRLRNVYDGCPGSSDLDRITIACLFMSEGRSPGPGIQSDGLARGSPTDIVHPRIAAESHEWMISSPRHTTTQTKSMTK